MQDLIELEEQGWRALSAAGDAAKEFYNSLLADDAVMVFSGGILIEGKENILGSIGSQPWKSFRLDRQRVIQLSENAAVVVYGVAAQREGNAPYRALISSTYALRKGKWKLIFHQQSPE